MLTPLPTNSSWNQTWYNLFTDMAIFWLILCYYIDALRNRPFLSIFYPPIVTKREIIQYSNWNQKDSKTVNTCFSRRCPNPYSAFKNTLYEQFIDTPEDSMGHLVTFRRQALSVEFLVQCLKRWLIRVIYTHTRIQYGDVNRYPTLL